MELAARYPLHLDLTGRRVLVVGAGPVSLRRVRALVQAGADVRVVAPEVTAELPAVPVERRAFRDSDVDGAWLVHACTGVVDERVAEACAARGVWCVRADDDAASPAWVPAVARVDDVVVSVSAGRDPRRARALRDAVALALETGEAPLRRTRPGPGGVALVAASSPDPDLLPVRGRRLLAGADVVVRDPDAPRVDLPDGVEVVDVTGQPVTGLLAERVGQGRRVVRLLGPAGDAAAERAACAAAGLTVELVGGGSA